MAINKRQTPVENVSKSMARKGRERVAEATKAVTLARIETYQNAVLKGSTPTAFRQFSARFRRPSCLTGSSVYLGPFQQKQLLTRPRRLPDQRSPLIPKRTPARRLPATRRPAMVGQQHAHSVLAGITGQ